jgi:hypothetical protein
MTILPRRTTVVRRVASAALMGALLGATLLTPSLVAAQCNAPFDRGDADGDGMVNHFEINVGTNPCDPDTDHDSLNDQQEVVIHGTNPHAPDSDGDGLSDRYELDGGSDPLVNNNVPAPAPAPADPDPDPAGRSDRDGDGLYDDDETDVYGTDPDNSDTDFDGDSDGLEVYNGTDPLG